MHGKSWVFSRTILQLSQVVVCFEGQKRILCIVLLWQLCGVG